MSEKIYYVTSNQGKFEEIKHFIKSNNLPIDLQQLEADIPEIQTLDQKAIAVDKAIKAWEILQKPLIIDDAAIYFEKYNKFPGTLSKFVSLGIGHEGLKKLIEDGDKATFLLYVVYISSPTNFKVFEGKCEGILKKPKEFYGSQNLPYDCLFVPNGTTETYADMRNTDEGNKFFYRIKALKQFLEWYKSEK